MSIEEKMRLVVVLDGMIHRKVSGSASKYAAKLRISRRAFFRLIDFMKAEMAAPIVHDKTENRFKYNQEGKLYFGFMKTNPLTKKEFETIIGGAIYYTTNLVDSK